MIKKVKIKKQKIILPICRNNFSCLWKKNVKKSIPFIGNVHYSWLANGMTSISWDNLIYKSDFFKGEIYESIMHGIS